MIDSLHDFLPLAKKSRIGEELGLAQGPTWCDFVVLTLHRPSNVDSPDKLKELLSAIDSIAEQLPVIFPVHPRTEQQLIQAGIVKHPSLRLIQPLVTWIFFAF